MKFQGSLLSLFSQIKLLSASDTLFSADRAVAVNDNSVMLVVATEDADSDEDVLTVGGTSFNYLCNGSQVEDVLANLSHQLARTPTLSEQIAAFTHYLQNDAFIVL